MHIKMIYQLLPMIDSDDRVINEAKGALKLERGIVKNAKKILKCQSK